MTAISRGLLSNHHAGVGEELIMEMTELDISRSAYDNKTAPTITPRPPALVAFPYQHEYHVCIS
ncbi:hypothetical protein CHS0354_029450 [Potamilus streckersoni]|uniref:Uncharacterized protein n=1 Tax=Potamilus streckersoni TaxID=2493646 RepID=A0AAE0W1P2_9BIVA|nr:hypothetical protein CHS0354_029450 [Potamilus streckersoni]